MSERLLEGMPGLAAIDDLFLSQDLFPLQLGDPLLIGRNDSTVARIYDAIQKLIDLLFELLDVRLQAFGGLRGLRQPHFPRIAEHGFDQREQPLSGL